MIIVCCFILLLVKGQECLPSSFFYQMKYTPNICTQDCDLYRENKLYDICELLITMTCVLRRDGSYLWL